MANILIIDDDKDVCEVLKNNLSLEGFNAYSACGGFEGIEKFRAGKFDLVILDLKLPDINGVDVLSEIRDFDKDIIVIILTGYPTVDTAVKTLKNNATDYISKPFEVSHLMMVIQRELLKKNTEREYGVADIANIGKRIKEEQVP